MRFIESLTAAVAVSGVSLGVAAGIQQIEVNALNSAADAHEATGDYPAVQTVEGLVDETEAIRNQQGVIAVGLVAIGVGATGYVRSRRTEPF
ncbi:MAG TPA: hypothetical protein VK674_06240 [Candidatus Limnocylindria bacterium]|nr:hypothetical protein [Candidatus Limnocylindria bacterium]